MKILGVQFSHEASFCIIENNNIIFYQEEQTLSGIKRDSNIKYLWKEISYFHFETIVFTFTKLNNENLNTYKKYIQHQCSLHNITYDELIPNFDHHLQHAACALFNSQFDSAYCLIMDGSGNYFNYKNKNIGVEIETIFNFNKNFKLIWKVCMGKNKSYSKNIHSIQSLSPALLFKFIANCIGSKEVGSVMGMASYLNEVPDIVVFHEEKELFTVDQGFLWNVLNKSIDKFEYTKAIQNASNEIVKKRIKKILDINKNANICLSGGFFQNCQINYDLLNMTKNIFVDPICYDGGTSMGSALLIAHRNKIKIKPYKNLYLGIQPIYPNNIIPNTNEKEIANLIANNNLIGIFQGRQEAGPRALGNRSLLFNPCNPHGKDIVNSFKGREWYRPLGGTVLYEHRDKFFNLNGKEQISYMSYAVKVKNKNVPAITHIDGSCRVQTLKLEQNVNFYKLIKEFYNLTSIPVVGNTSLNIAGSPIVGTYEQALYFFKNTPLKYLYFPDIQHLLKK